MIGGVGVWARGLFGCRPLPSDQQNAQTYHPTSGHMPLPPPSLFLALTPTALVLSISCLAAMAQEWDCFHLGSNRMNQCNNCAVTQLDSWNTK